METGPHERKTLCKTTTSHSNKWSGVAIPPTPPQLHQVDNFKVQRQESSKTQYSKGKAFKEYVTCGSWAPSRSLPALAPLLTHHTPLTHLQYTPPQRTHTPFTTARMNSGCVRV
ncbi:hypothetical protein E2C01_005261 [Portunus trituberculatus]|uniref:Uncharacterized protein n=1 Tax=Portunus trituberculatus TaxID=210409 RepID=A0A5B7CUN9_PORTR|nr:hypothetical protein [Portunus trituberculatus]